MQRAVRLFESANFREFCRLLAAFSNKAPRWMGRLLLWVEPWLRQSGDQGKQWERSITLEVDATRQNTHNTKNRCRHMHQGCGRSAGRKLAATAEAHAACAYQLAGWLAYLSDI